MAQRRTLHDEFFRRAKREGYVARSAYKLKEINDKRAVIRRGDRVLDLGCAPGSWLQVAGELVGGKGVVVGVDLQVVRERFDERFRVIQGDAFEISPESLMEAAGGPFDVVLSDMAPNTTGAGDHFRSVALCERVLDLAAVVLRRGGNLTMKVLEGETYPDLVRRTNGMFERAKGLKPKASRDVSTEMFIVAHGFRAGAGAGAGGAGAG